MPTLETERLAIRELTSDAADLTAVHALLDDGDGALLDARRRWLDWTVLSYQQLAELHQPPYGDRAMCLRGDSRHVVGLCGLAPCLGPFGSVLGKTHSSRAVPEVGLYWAVAPEHRRRGYASEAGRALVDYVFGTLGVRRVIATTTFDNAASIGVMRRLGMQVHDNSRPEPAWLQAVGVLYATG